MGAIWSLKHLCESQVGCEDLDPLHSLDAVDEAVWEAPRESHMSLLLSVAGELYKKGQNMGHGAIGFVNMRNVQDSRSRNLRPIFLPSLYLLVDVLLDVAVYLLEGLDERRVLCHALHDLLLQGLEGLEDFLLLDLAGDGDVGVLRPVVLLVVVPNLGRN